MREGSRLVIAGRRPRDSYMMDCRQAANGLFQAPSAFRHKIFPSTTTCKIAIPQFCAMSNNAIKPGLISSLEGYLERKDQEYKTRYECWLSGVANHQYPPTTWPADQCLLTRLPAELLVLICEPLYQADLFHLALTCRALAHYPTHLLYTRDITDFDCLALRWACTFGTVPTLQRTLSYGAPVDHVFDARSHAECSWAIGGPFENWLCNTPLKTAIAANEPEIIRVLCAHGADVNARDAKLTGFEYKRWELLCPINFVIGSPDMPAIKGFEFGNPQIVRCLLDAGADPNQYTSPGRPLYRTPKVLGVTPLVMAMQASVPVETVKLLLERGANPMLIGSYEGFFRYQGHFLVTGGHIRGAPGEFWDRSPLCAALFCSVVTDIWPLDPDKIQLLLAHGGLDELGTLRIPQQSRQLQPVLYRYWNNMQIVKLMEMFIAAGADIAGWAARGISPILSVIWWAERFISLSWKKGAVQKVSNALIKTCEVIKLLAEATLVRDAGEPIQKSAIIDEVVLVSAEAFCPLSGLPEHRKDQTALRYVCGPFRFVGATTLVPLLLHYGADINSADSAGRTALHHAAMFTSGERVRMLVKFVGRPASSGLAVNARDAQGWTPLHYACLFGFWTAASGQVITARLLLDNGADIQARTTSGWTPLSLAIFSANPGMVELLLNRGGRLHDLLLLPPGCENQVEPTTVPVGRFMLLRRDELSCQGLLADLMPELAASRTRIAKLLESRIGISLPVTRRSEMDYPSLPPGSMVCHVHVAREEGEYYPDLPLGHMLWNIHTHPQLPAFRVDMVDSPFGMSRVDFNKLTTPNFDQDMNGVLNALEQYGLEAWIASVGDPPHALMFWEGRRSSDDPAEWA